MAVDVLWSGEARRMEVAVIGDGQLVLTFVYALRGNAVRCISVCLTSRIERRMYDEWQADSRTVEGCGHATDTDRWGAGAA